MTLAEAAKQGISRLRKPFWANDDDVLVLTLHGQHYAAVGTLLSPSSARAGMPDLAEQKVVLIGDTGTDWEAAP